MLFVPLSLGPSIFTSLLLFLSFVCSKCLIWFVFCRWGLNSNGFCFFGFGVLFLWVLFFWWELNSNRFCLIRKKKTSIAVNIKAAKITIKEIRKEEDDRLAMWVLARERERERKKYVLSYQLVPWFSKYLQQCHWAMLLKN